MTKFKVGDRVRQFTTSSKDTGVIIEATYSQNRGTYTLLYDKDGSKSMHHWHDNELELITSKSKKEEKSMTRRTFRQLKDSVTIKKGAIFQEQCEDGTQPYELITPEFYKGNLTPGTIKDRSLVEGQPEWFEEVEMIWQPLKKPTRKYKKTGKYAKKATPVAKSKMVASWTPERRKAQARRMRKMHKQGKFGAK